MRQQQHLHQQQHGKKEPCVASSPILYGETDLLFAISQLAHLNYVDLRLSPSETFSGKRILEMAAKLTELALEELESRKSVSYRVKLCLTTTVRGSIRQFLLLGSALDVCTLAQCLSVDHATLSFPSMVNAVKLKVRDLTRKAVVHKKFNVFFIEFFTLETTKWF
jgi:hypothetical protein